MSTVAKRLVALFAIIALGLTLTACGDSPPAELSQRAGKVSADITATKDFVQKSREQLDAELKKPEYGFAAKYTGEQLRKPKFDEAQAKIDEAQKLYDGNVKGQIDDYDANRQGEIISSLDNVQKLIDEANAAAKQPGEWIKRVLATKQNPAGYVQGLAAKHDPLAQTAESLVALGNTYKADWPNQVKSIDERIGKVTGELKSASDALAKLRAEAAKKPPNFAVMTTLGDQVAVNGSSFSQNDATMRNQLAELPTSETHTLVDISVEGTIEVGRSSWSESHDSETDFDYPTINTTDGELLAYYSQFQEGTLIASDGWMSDFKMESGVETAKWDALGIDARKDFPGSDDTAEYYLEGVDITTCYQLKVLRNGMPDSSGKPADIDNPCAKLNTPQGLADGEYWEEADGLNADSIGMDIYSKASGEFADQATEAAAPPGMVHVGNPQTGEWKQDSNGNDFWSFYGPYLFYSQLLSGNPNPYIYRNEYDTWNRDYRREDRDYYPVAGGGSPRFGAGSPQASNSRYAQFNTSKLGTPSVRNAGPAIRGGGPGGGGK